MRTTKAQLEAQVKMLRWNQEKLFEETQKLRKHNEYLEKQLGYTTKLLERFSELPQAVYGATEALAHMLTDARVLYMGRK